MNKKITEYLAEREREVAHISAARRETLKPLVEFILEKQRANESTELTFICTHNARRSQMAQLWCSAAALYCDLEGIECFSGGVAVTQFHPNAISAMENAGFIFNGDDEGDNPRLLTRIGEGVMLELYSKRFDDDQNPGRDFGAVMVCSDAETNCPFVPGAAKRISITYEDPKTHDDDANPVDGYEVRSAQIATEMLYAMKQVSEFLN